MTKRCISKITSEGNRECGRPIVYLTAERAKAQGRGIYSGWYHESPISNETHQAVPDDFRPVTTPPR